MKEQTYQHFESILIDDGSQDTSKIICTRICSPDSESMVRRETKAKHKTSCRCLRTVSENVIINSVPFNRNVGVTSVDYKRANRKRREENMSKERFEFGKNWGKFLGRSQIREPIAGNMYQALKIRTNLLRFCNSHRYSQRKAVFIWHSYIRRKEIPPIYKLILHANCF